MSIRGMSIDLEKVREIDITVDHGSNGNGKFNGKNGKRHGTVTLENGTYLKYDKDEIEGSVTISVPGIRGEMTFNWNDDEISHINSDWW